MSKIDELTRQRAELQAIVKKEAAQRATVADELADLEAASKKSLAQVALDKLRPAAERQAKARVKHEALKIYLDELTERDGRRRQELADLDAAIKAEQLKAAVAARGEALRALNVALADVLPAYDAAWSAHQAAQRLGHRAAWPWPAELHGLITKAARLADVQRATEKGKVDNLALARKHGVGERTIERDLATVA